MKRHALLGVGALILLAFGYGVATTPRAKPHLKASVTHAGTALAVANEDHQDWNNVRVTVNDTFECHVEHLEAGQATRVPLSTCVASDGARFNIVTTAPMSVRVTAVLVDETGDATERFTFER